MSLPYLIRPLARQDIDAAYDWYEAQAVGRGDAFLLELRDAIASICQSPHLYGRVRGEVRAAPLPRSQYIVYYRIEAARVSILSVSHSASHPTRWHGRT